MYNSIQAYGLYQFAKNRYQTFQNNAKTWDYSKSAVENHAKRGIRGWGYMPGLPLDPKRDHSVDDLKDVPAENLDKVVEAEAFCQEWLASPPTKDADKNDKNEANKVAKISIPEGWETAYDLRTSAEFSSRPRS